MYKIKLSDKAQESIQNIYHYILSSSMNEASAKKVLKKIENSIKKLDILPTRHPVYKGKHIEHNTVRYFPIPSYIIIYTVNEENSEVEIIDVSHERSNKHRYF